MELSNIEFFFYEWLIIEKHINEEGLKNMTDEDFNKLKLEFIEVYNKSSVIQVN